jgi:ribosomal-protein-alanine N-acetyltransferase
MREAGQIEIRTMRPEDAAPAAQLERTLFSLPWTEAGFRTSIESADTIYLCAWQGEELAGYCGLLRSFDEADITNVAVRKELQGRGIGRNMLLQLMQEGREAGIVRYTLEVRVSNAPAIHLYESLGFHSVGIRKNFYELPREDAMIMWTAQPED